MFESAPANRFLQHRSGKHKPQRRRYDGARMKQRALGDLLLKPARQKTKGAARPGRARLPGKAALQKLDGMVDQDRAENPLRFGEHVLQRFFHVLFGVGQCDHADRGTLPYIVKIQLSYGDVELAA